MENKFELLNKNKRDYTFTYSNGFVVTEYNCTNFIEATERLVQNGYGLDDIFNVSSEKSTMYLAGEPCLGKSSVLINLAKKLGYEYIDLETVPLAVHEL